MTKHKFPLSPIILSKLYSSEEKITFQASLNRDVFTIYQIKDAVSKKSYCKKISNYLNENKRSSNSYYKCDNCNQNVDVNYENNYIVIEFNDPSSIINIDSVQYTVKKITFYAPTYHYVKNDPKYSNDTFPNKGTQDLDRNLESNESFIKNCLEIEILCENAIGSLLSVSVLCNADKNDEIDAKNINTFAETDGTQRSFFGLIYKYIVSNDEQLYTGGYKDKTRLLNIHDLLPANKHFFKYNGTLFETKPIGQQDLTSVTRIVFQNHIQVPYIFFNKIQDRITHSNSSCGNGKQLNQFVDYTPKHNLIFSDTNIDFLSNDYTKPKKKVDKTLFAVVIFFILLLILFGVIWLWTEGFIPEMLRGIFEESPIMLKLFDILKI